MHIHILQPGGLLTSSTAMADQERNCQDPEMRPTSPRCNLGFNSAGLEVSASFPVQWGSRCARRVFYDHP